ncbi:hypothetical protein K9L97_00735 [Candidatus Woesearchaeota archaeon]|nr:hypothetical protein [Candidatus Woesearchaeota archaeon]
MIELNTLLNTEIKNRMASQNKLKLHVQSFISKYQIRKKNKMKYQEKKFLEGIKQKMFWETITTIEEILNQKNNTIDLTTKEIEEALYLSINTAFIAEPIKRLKTSKKPNTTLYDMLKNIKTPIYSILNDKIYEHIINGRFWENLCSTKYKKEMNDQELKDKEEQEQILKEYLNNEIPLEIKFINEGIELLYTQTEELPIMEFETLDEIEIMQYEKLIKKIDELDENKKPYEYDMALLLTPLVNYILDEELENKKLTESSYKILAEKIQDPLFKKYEDEYPLMSLYSSRIENELKHEIYETIKLIEYLPNKLDILYLTAIEQGNPKNWHKVISEEIVKIDACNYNIKKIIIGKTKDQQKQGKTN